MFLFSTLQSGHYENGPPKGNIHEVDVLFRDHAAIMSARIILQTVNEYW